MKKITILILFLSFTLLTLPLIASARMQFVPHFAVSEEYNDNIYLDPWDEEDDWITTLDPGITFLYDSRVFVASLDYSWHLEYYKDNTDENITDFKEIQRAAGTATLFPGRPFTVVAYASAATVIVDERKSTSDQNSIVNSALSYDFSINPSYNWRITSTFQASLGYTYHYVAYQELGSWEYENRFDEPIDWQEHVINFELNKQFSSRTSCGIGYVFTDHKYKDRDYEIGEGFLRDDYFDEDFQRHDVFASLEQKIGSRLMFNLTGGVAFYNFDKSDSDNGDFWNVALDYKASDRLNLGLLYSQNYEVSVSRGISKSDEARATIAYHDRFNISLEGFSTQDKYSEGSITFDIDNSEDKSIGCRLNSSYPLGKRFTFNFDADYAHWKFDSGFGIDNEKADRYTIGGAIDYNFLRDFNISLSYSYLNNDSNFDFNDYDNNIVSLSIAWRLNPKP